MPRMSNVVLEQMIKTFLQETTQNVYQFGWQGGEPTLMGLSFYQNVITFQKKYKPIGAQVANALQTNGILMDEPFAEFLAQHRFLVGLSLDGTAEMHNRFRRNAQGQGTQENVIQSMNLLKKKNVEFNVLTLVTRANVNCAKEIYRYFIDLDVFFQQYIPCVEYDSAGKLKSFAIDGKAWGRFLIDLFETWEHDGYRASIRLFDAILILLETGNYSLCHMGGSCQKYLVVEHNGDVYPCDFHVDAGNKLGNVMEDRWADMWAHERFKAFSSKKAKWNAACENCDFLMFCSGDCMKHTKNEDDSRSLSELCEGWKMFYKETLPRFKEIARNDLRHRTGQKDAKLFCDGDFNRNETCYCGSGLKYKNCHK